MSHEHGGFGKLATIGKTFDSNGRRRMCRPGHELRGMWKWDAKCRTAVVGGAERSEVPSRDCAGRLAVRDHWTISNSAFHGDTTVAPCE